MLIYLYHELSHMALKNKMQSPNALKCIKKNAIT